MRRSSQRFADRTDSTGVAKLSLVLVVADGDGVNVFRSESGFGESKSDEFTLESREHSSESTSRGDCASRGIEGNFSFSSVCKRRIYPCPFSVAQATGRELDGDPFSARCAR
jgi:hypothetical protein